MPSLIATPNPEIEQADQLLSCLRVNTTNATGITHDTYGDGENFAHNLMASTALNLGLEVTTLGGADLWGLGTVDLNAFTNALHGCMDPHLRHTLNTLEMASGAGPDAFVRNQHGSHHANEAMEMADLPKDGSC